MVNSHEWTSREEGKRAQLRRLNVLVARIWRITLDDMHAL
jgi:hypothetical protein